MKWSGSGSKSGGWGLSGAINLNRVVRKVTLHRPEEDGGSKPCGHLGKSSPQKTTACAKALRQKHAWETEAASVTEAEDKKARMKAGPLEAAVGILAKENLEQTSDMIYSWNSLEGRGCGQKQGDHFRANTITQARWEGFGPGWRQWKWWEWLDFSSNLKIEVTGFAMCTGYKCGKARS